jgi:branched-chain amino acid transport system permease protein
MGVVAMAAAYIFQESRFGLALRASREDVVSAKASGINVFGVRLLALVISAFFKSIAGVLYGHYLGTISVDVFWLDTTFITLAMLVVGGSRSLAGAVVGVLSMTALTEILRRVEGGFTIGSISISAPDGLQQIALALVMILILVFRPQGLMGGRKFRGHLESRRTIPPTWAPSGPRIWIL